MKVVVLDPDEVKAQPQAWRLMGETVSDGARQREDGVALQRRVRSAGALWAA